MQISGLVSGNMPLSAKADLKKKKKIYTFNLDFQVWAKEN